MHDSRLEQLDIGQWAWEFLRRNPEYQADYREFIDIWQQLEVAYGSPPNRDFQKWKADPRSTRPAYNPEQVTGASCTVDEDERQLIECWMGAKWGFYQFPQNPELAAWELEASINWRPAPGYRFDREPSTSTDIKLTFDLAYPLPAQLDTAKQWLISQQAALRRQGGTVPLSLAGQREHWAKLLLALDGGQGEMFEEAREMSRKGYRKILRLLPQNN